MPSRVVALAVTALVALPACMFDQAGAAEQTLTRRDTSQQFVISPAQGAVMGPQQAPDLRRTCGRAVPAMHGYWAPDARTIAELEARLPALLDAEVPSGERPRHGEIAIIRQYAGMIREGRRVVYVNAWTDHGSPDPSWRHTVMLTCDGGPLNFGVLYDPETRTFSHFAGNGPI
jgi:hypothetical protein